MQFTKLFALALVTASTAVACKCRDRQTTLPDWKASRDCCWGTGWWVFKDCRIPDHRFGECCRHRGWYSDC